MASPDHHLTDERVDEMRARIRASAAAGAAENEASSAATPAPTGTLDGIEHRPEWNDDAADFAAEGLKRRGPAGA